MIKVSIQNSVNGRSFGATFETQAEADVWINQQVSKQSWGKNVYDSILEENIAPNERAIFVEEVIEQLESVDESGNLILDEQGNPVMEDLIRYKFNTPVEYQIEIVDLSLDPEYQLEQVMKARQSEYSKLDSMFLEAIAEKELGSDVKMQEYLALRAQIKIDHPKP